MCIKSVKEVKRGVTQDLYATFSRGDEKMLAGPTKNSLVGLNILPVSGYR